MSDIGKAFASFQAAFIAAGPALQKRMAEMARELNNAMRNAKASRHEDDQT